MRQTENEATLDGYVTLLSRLDRWNAGKITLAPGESPYVVLDTLRFASTLVEVDLVIKEVDSEIYVWLAGTDAERLQTPSETGRWNPDPIMMYEIA